MFRLWWKSKTIRIDIAPVPDVEEPEPPPVLVAVTVSKPNTGTRIGPTEIGGKRVIVTCVRSALKEHPIVREPVNGPLALAFVVFTRKTPVKVASRGTGTFMRLPFWSTMLSSALLHCCQEWTAFALLVQRHHFHLFRAIIQKTYK